MTKSHNRFLKGGKVLGIGADGCVFSEASWPCATPLSGYNPSDPSVVSKLVVASDNEDHIITLALSIVPPEDKKHLIGFIGTCTPSTKAIAAANAKTAKEFDENEAEILDLYKNYHLKPEPTRGNPNSCIRIATWQAQGAYNSIKSLTNEYYNTYEDVKVIVNKKYQQTLYKYLKDHVSDISFTPLLKGCVKYVKVLETLAEGVDGRRIVNVDLHTANIFVNQDSEDLIVGAADFGRCAIQEGNELNERKKLTTFLTDYMNKYNIIFKFPIIPFELKLYNFIKQYKNTDVTKVEYVLRIFAQVITNIEARNNITPFSLFDANIVATILIKYFKNFNTMIISYKFTDPYEEIEFIRLCLLNRFNNIGFLQVLIQQLIYVDIYRNKAILTTIKNNLVDYILHDKLFTPTSDLEKLYKLYFDTLLAPQKEFLSEIPKPSNYISSLISGGPHVFSTSMAVALGFGSVTFAAGKNTKNNTDKNINMTDTKAVGNNINRNINMKGGTLARNNNSRIIVGGRKTRKTRNKN